MGTVTEIYDYLRLLFARIGKVHCYKCGQAISQQTVEQMVDRIMTYPEGTRLQILAPLVRGRKGEYQKLLENIRKEGYVRVRVDGEVREVNEEIQLDKNKKHTIEVVVDRIIIRPQVEQRLADSLETAINLTGGIVTVDIIGQEEIIFSQNFACVDCGISFEEIAPRMFSFNNPYGACPECTGLGFKTQVDPELVIPDPTMTLAEGAIAPWNKRTFTWYAGLLNAVTQQFNIPQDVPFKDLSKEEQQLLLYGAGRQKIKVSYQNNSGQLRTFETYYEGVIPNLERRYRETQSEHAKSMLESYMSSVPCFRCHGTRLKEESLAVTVGGKNIWEVTCFPGAGFTVF